MAARLDRFLRPGVRAAADGRADFAEFTFDHHVHGTIAAEWDDTGELFLLLARGDRIIRRVLVPGAAQGWSEPA